MRKPQRDAYLGEKVVILTPCDIVRMLESKP
jgi:hypothetical protein